MSCTDKIEHSTAFLLDDCMVTLIDTPGFDDTAKSDAEVLNIVADYLANESVFPTLTPCRSEPILNSIRYREKRLLHGIIYMHRISDNRMSGTATRNLRFFQDLCGQDVLCNGVIVTNMWGSVDPTVGAAREQELKSKDLFFKPALQAGARVLRHDNTVASAHRIVRHLLAATPRPLRLQRELVDEGRRVFQTAAGETLLQELALLEQRLAVRRITISVTDAARAWLADTGYDPAYGARPLRRLIQSAIGDPLARLLIAGTVTDGGAVTVDVGDDGLVLT